MSRPAAPRGERVRDGFTAYQYDDLLVRPNDRYAMTKYRIILGYLRAASGLDILNAGCGSGELSFLLARAGHRVLGIDSTPRYIELARRGAEALGVPGCSFEVSAIEEFEARTRFDCVVATDVLEHVRDDRAAFAKLATLARRSGSIIVTVPAGQWLFGYHDESLGHFRRYSIRDLRQMARGCCEIEAVRHFGFSLVPICYLYSKVLRRPYPVAETGGGARSRLLGRVLQAVLELDRRVRVPFGTSIVMKGRTGLS